MPQTTKGNPIGQPATLPAGLFSAPAAAPVLVLGIGNLLLGDEGAGLRVVENLTARYTLPPEVEALDGGTMGMALLPYLAGRRLLLLIDAVRTGAAPGTVVQMELSDPAAFCRGKISPHQIGIAEVLAVAALTNELPGRMVVIGVEPKEMNTGLTLSPEISDQIGAMADMVAAELTAAGFALRPREPVAA